MLLRPRLRSLVLHPLSPCLFRARRPVRKFSSETMQPLASMCFNCALAWHYPYGDHRRIFGQGTPKEVWQLMEQT